MPAREESAMTTRNQTEPFKIGLLAADGGEVMKAR